MFTTQEIARFSQKNPWLKDGGIYFEDDPYLEMDSPFGVYNCSSIEQLEEKLGQGGWSIRSCFTYQNLAFVNQVPSGDEWLTIYKHEDGRLEDFESITFERIIERGEFKEYMERLLQGPDTYWGRNKAS